ncbi:MAG: PRC-barrel domain-containing protein [Terracidiphilus sp.]
MLIKAKALEGYSLKCLDGDIGSASEFFFDDRYWAIRYFVANTGTWLRDKKVLISPYSLIGVNASEGRVSVQLTKKQIEDCPSTDMDEPVSRQYEDSYNGYYGFPNYWGGPYMWGSNPYMVRDRSRWGVAASQAMGWDRHLRSTREVTGYHLHALDGEVGHVDDFIIDDDTWAIRYLVVATKNWWPGKKVLISPKWIESVSWKAREVVIGLSRETVKSAPEYTAESLLTRDYETVLYGHYNREGYWVDELTAV